MLRPLYVAADGCSLPHSGAWRKSTPRSQGCRRKGARYRGRNIFSPKGIADTQEQAFDSRKFLGVKKRTTSVNQMFGCLKLERSINSREVPSAQSFLVMKSQWCIMLINNKLQMLKPYHKSGFHRILIPECRSVYPDVWMFFSALPAVISSSERNSRHPTTFL